jgi:hypothetical protein
MLFGFLFGGGGLPGDGVGFWVRDAELFGPEDPNWAAMGRREREAFRRDVAETVVAMYARERERGVSASGRRLKRLAESTIRNRRSALGTADPSAPPLIPGDFLSRTILLLRYRVRPDGVWFYWDRDPVTGKSWGAILDIHRQGNARLPARDVIGITLKLKREARDVALERWAAVVDPRGGGGGRLGWLRRRLRELVANPVEDALPPVRQPPRRRPLPDWRKRVDKALEGLDDYDQAGTDRLRRRQAVRRAAPPWQAPPPMRGVAPGPPRFGR